ncbi:MAG: MBOAT family O-acyltransferase [Eubacteriales bacterium]|nr:MBOAT family O-acyltransferase [Eubacteriales bacterium]
MVFSGIPFLYFFLPVLLLFYFISPDKIKNPVLLLFSLIFYASGEPKNIIVMLVTVLIAYCAALWFSKLSGKGRKAVFAVSVILSLLPLLYFKYSDFLIINVNTVTGLSIPKTGAVLPIGISFYTFQVVGYLADVYRNDCKAAKNPLDLALYISLFPQLIAGPIVRYTDVNDALASRVHSMELTYRGIMRFSVGLFKKVLIANVLGELCNSLGVSMLGGWVYALASSLQIYYDFSGYSDMAIGLGMVFGFSFPENFNYPYISSSVAEFWRRWHISLGSWFRDYVYIPLGGNRVSFVKWIRNILVVWMLTGLWHGAEWTFVLWGLYFAVFLVLEKLCKGFFAKLPKAVKHIYVILAVMISFVLFDSASVSDFAARIGTMFDFTNLSDTSSLYYVKSYAVTLIVAVIGSTPLIKNALSRTNEKVKAVLSPIVCASVLIVSTAYIIGGSYNPFLYFRF